MESIVTIDAKEEKVTTVCQICLKESSKYTCPRCNVLYCSLSCYKAEKHMDCSESFYKDCFTEGLKDHTVSSEERSRMLEMLQKLETENPADLDSDDDESDLEDRLNGLDLDTDTEKIWNRLTEKEKKEFQAMASDGRLGNLVEVWTPWWSIKEKKVKDLEEDIPSHLPPIIKDVPDINTLLSKSKPSTDIKHNIVNILFSYAFICRLHNGDHMMCAFQSTTELLSVCEVLDKNLVCGSPADAVHHVMKCIQESHTFSEPRDFQVSIIQDVINILRGPSKSGPLDFVMRAVSQVYHIFSQGQRSSKKTADQNKTSKHADDCDSLDKKHISRIKKKLLFLLGWIQRCGMVLQTMIPELQLEFGAMQNDLQDLHHTQESVKKNWTHIQNKVSKTSLIEEIK